MNTLDDINDIHFAKRIDMILKVLIIDKGDLYDEEHIEHGGYVNINFVYNLNKDKGYSKEEFISTFDAAFYLGLLTTTPKYTHSKRELWATNYGNYIYQNGGAEKHFLNKEKERSLTHQLAKSTLDSNTISKRFVWVSGIIFFIGLLIQIGQYKTSTKQTDIQQVQANIEYKALHKQLHDSLCHLLHHNILKYKNQGIENNEYLLSIDTVSKKP